MNFDDKIPFYSLEHQHRLIRNELNEAFNHELDKNWFILGETVRAFENCFANYIGTKHCIGVSNGLDALILSIKALNIGAGDEVIIPSNTYIATALAVSHCGAIPVFAEPRIETYNISPETIEEKINPKTRAIIPVHLYGQACEMDKIMQIAARHSIKVIEDNAQSQGALCGEKKTGSFGHINATSFYPGKNIGALGDAGAVTTDDEALSFAVCTLRNYGSQKKYYNEVPGYNMRLDELQAAFLQVKLNYLDEWNAERERIAQFYREGLNGIGDVILPGIASGCTSVYHQFVIRTRYREALAGYLHDHQIGTLIHYPIPVHLQAAYSHLGFKKGDFPLAEEISDTVLSLPVFIGITEAQMERVVDCIRRFFKNKFPGSKN